MATVKITWADRNGDEEGHYVYRDTVPLDPAALPVPLATLGPDIVSYDDTTAAADTTYYYGVAAYKGDSVAFTAGGEINTAAAPAPDYSTAAVGDEIGGGIYAGTITYADSRQFHIVFAKQAGESAEGPEWGNYGTSTGAGDEDDGLANQELVLADFDNGDSEAFYHCRDYTDDEGNNDYYLPARNELALVDALVDMAHAEFSTDLSTYRWSSTEYSSYSAWLRRFSGGFEASDNKYDTDRRVRPVRRIPV